MSDAPTILTTMDKLIKQYHDLKQKHPDAILLFRVGDFYECYGADAVLVSHTIGVTLVRRITSTASTDLAGFPQHALDMYLPKLIRAGYRIAICEQVETTATQKLVKRGSPALTNE